MIEAAGATDAAGIVLCGGRSERMGRAKAWLPWGGEPMVAHVVAKLSSIVDEVVVVSSQELELPKLDAKIVCDREPALGPLSGIREGLACIRSTRAFVTATDTPFLSSALVRALLDRAGAAAPDVHGYVQTLSAVYPRIGLAHAEAMVAAGQLRPLELLERLDYERIEAGELPEVASARGFNTPDEYLDAVRETFGDTRATLEFLGRSRSKMGRRELEVPVGTLGEVLSAMEPVMTIVAGDEVAKPFLVSLDGREFVRSTAIPIGPGERVVVLDASVGG